MFFLPTKSWKNHVKKLHTYGSWDVFISAAWTAQISPDLQIRFIISFIQSSLLRSLIVSLEKLSNVLEHFWAITDMGHLRGFTTWSQHFSCENQAKVKEKKQWVLKIDDSYGWFFFSLPKCAQFQPHARVITLSLLQPSTFSRAVGSSKNCKGANKVNIFWEGQNKWSFINLLSPIYLYF